MRYNDWEAKLTALNKRAEPLLVDEEVLSETFNTEYPSITTREITIQLGYSEIVFYIDGTKEYSVRSLYYSGDKSWMKAFGALNTKVELAEMLHKKLVDGLVQPYIKEAVLERITSGDDIPDNETIIKNAAIRRLNKLGEMLPKPKVWVNENYSLPSPVKNHSLVVEIRGNNFTKVTYDISSIRGAWSLLCNYEAIEATVQEFCKVYTPLLKFLERGD